MNPLEFAKNTVSKIKKGEKKKKIPKKFIIIGAIILALIIGLVVFLVVRSKMSAKHAKPNYAVAYARVGDITETIEQSGVVEPYERREITSLAKGEIVASPFEEGDYVEEGQMLYRIDDEDAQLNIEKANINLEETEESIRNLNIYADASGTISDLKLKEGENAQSGVVAYITNNSTLTADIPFTSSDFDNIKVGDSVTVTSALYMTSIKGKVTHKYNGITGASRDGSSVKNIEVEIENPGAFATDTTVAAVVSTSKGNVYSTGSGSVKSGGTTSVTCQVQGSKVKKINVKNGDYVKKGQLIATLENNSLYMNKRSNELNLKSSQKMLDNYNITAPISGTVITKNSKLGDKIDNSNSQTVMMVIADMSKMKFTITVDELDVSKIKEGQKVIVDADAIENQTFEGRVTSVAAEGVSSGDGVTTYQVEIVIDEPGELRSGMNVNANIVINEAKNVVYIPEEALMMKNGNTAMVLVKSDGSKKADEDKTDKQNEAEKTEDSKPAADNGAKTESDSYGGGQGTRPNGGGQGTRPEGGTYGQGTRPQGGTYGGGQGARPEGGTYGTGQGTKPESETVQEERTPKGVSEENAEPEKEEEEAEGVNGLEENEEHEMPERQENRDESMPERPQGENAGQYTRPEGNANGTGQGTRPSGGTYGGGQGTRPNGGTYGTGQNARPQGNASGTGQGNASSEANGKNAGGTFGNGGGKMSGGNIRAGMNIPEGYELRMVEIGISDGTNVEIVSGLSEGDEIIYIAQTASLTSGFMGGMPGMGGGMPGMGGGMPRGGMTGGNRAGGMTGGNRQQSGMRR